MRNETTTSRTRLDAGKEAIVEALQRVMRAASIRPLELGIQWIENDSELSLVIRWGEKDLRLTFQKQDIEAWPGGNYLPAQYRDHVRHVSTWLMGLAA